jgi:dTDP-4-amino-4,6-dideoxygalactose transaminase
LVEYKWPIITDEMKKAVVEVLENDFHPPGKQCTEFEKEFAEFCDVKYAVAVSSGTAALHLSMLACGLGPGDEVITPSNSMSSSADCILFVGAKPVFVDIDVETFNIDTNKIEEKITSKTKAILPVHLNGHPADLDPIMDLAEDHELFVIDDACHSAGAKYKGKRLGSLCDMTCFSFVSKSMTVGGDGGMLVTNNEKFAETADMLRRHGRKRDGTQVMLGYNYRMGEMAAALGRLQLKELDKWNVQRRRNAKLYSEFLRDAPIKCPVESEWAYHVYLSYFIEGGKRDALRSFLSGKGIRTRNPYTPIHALSYITERFGNLDGTLPVTETHYKNALGLPVYPSMTKEDIEQVANNIKEYYRDAS